MKHVAFFLTILGCFFTSPSMAKDQTCTLTFDVIAGNALGTINPGEQLAGKIEFSTTKSWLQDKETLSYFSDGKVSVTHPDKGSVQGHVRVVHVVRTPYTADYISIDANLAKGNLGGEKSYEDPMLITFYSPPGTLSTSELPRTTAEWNRLSKRRFFQVHTPDAMSTFYGDFNNVTGQCS
jgi:hypothetical protein